jgi:integrase
VAAPKKFRYRRHVKKDGSTSYYARFTDQHGVRRETRLGSTPTWNDELAATAMGHIQADVERGTWAPTTGRRTNPQRLIFEDLAYDWWDARIAGRKADRTQEAYRAELDGHLMPYFGPMAVAAITKHDVDSFVQSRVKRGLAPAYINSQLNLLGQILEVGMDWYEGILATNPARGKQRRVEGKKTTEPERWLEANHVELILLAARTLDRAAARADYRLLGRESLVAGLCFAGLRNTELCELTWADIDVDKRIIRVGGGKTPSASRDITIVDGLVGLLRAHQNETPYPRQTDPVWPTATGKHRDKDNLNRRMVQPVVTKARELADETQESAPAEGVAPKEVVLPAHITPHTFRRTFCGFATEEAKDPYYVQMQMGHRSAQFTQRVYNRVRSRWSGVSDPRVLAWMQRP